MQLTQIQRRIPTGPIVLLMAILAVMALALTTWYALVRSEPTQTSVVNRTPATTVTSCAGLVAPDALDRCEQILQTAQAIAARERALSPDAGDRSAQLAYRELLSKFNDQSPDAQERNIQLISR